MTDPIEAAILEAESVLTAKGACKIPRKDHCPSCRTITQNRLRSLVSTVRALERETTLEEAEGVCEYSRDKRNIRALKVQGAGEAMKKAKQSAMPRGFTEWFEAQFGKRPSGRPCPELVEELESLEAEVKYKRRILQAVEQWEEHERAALYAWNARPKVQP